MPIPAPRDLKIGMIVEETLGVLERCALPAIIFIIILALVNGAVAYFGLEYVSVGHQLAKGAVTFIVGIVGTFLLYETMLRKTGFHSGASSDGDAFLPYLGLSILYTLGVGVGLILLIFPGLFFMARWSIAQPLLLAQGSGVTKSLKESWERTKGNEFPILVAALVLLVLPLAISLFAGIMYEEGDLVGLVISQVASTAMNVISIAMGIALFSLIVVERDPARAFS